MNSRAGFRRHTVAVLHTLVILLLSACAAPSASLPHGSQPSEIVPPEPTSQESVLPEPPLENAQATGYQVYPPRAYYGLFKPEETGSNDELIYNTIVDYLHRPHWWGEGAEMALSLLSMRVIDEWTDPWADFSWKEPGFDWSTAEQDSYSEYYLIYAWHTGAYDFSEQFMKAYDDEEPNPEEYSFQRFYRVKVTYRTPYVSWRQEIEIIRMFWTGDGIYDLEVMCEGRPETYDMLMDVFRNGSGKITFKRDLLVLSRDEMEQIYLERYFPQYAAG